MTFKRFIQRFMRGFDRWFNPLEASTPDCKIEYRGLRKWLQGNGSKIPLYDMIQTSYVMCLFFLAGSYIGWHLGYYYLGMIDRGDFWDSPQPPYPGWIVLMLPRFLGMALAMNYCIYIMYPTNRIGDD